MSASGTTHSGCGGVPKLFGNQRSGRTPVAQPAAVPAFRATCRHKTGEPKTDGFDQMVTRMPFSSAICR